MSPSRRPSIIWSRTHSSEQKLQVLTSSRRDTRKSSKDSPGCCTRAKVSTFNGFIDVAFNVALDGLHYGLDVPFLVFCQTKVVDDCQGFTRETEHEGLYLFSLCFLVEFR